MPEEEDVKKKKERHSHSKVQLFIKGIENLSLRVRRRTKMFSYVK